MIAKNTMITTAYVKPTNFCNIDCDHCYLPKEIRANKNKMNSDQLRKVTTFLLSFSKKRRHSGVFFLWHGGEPLILQPDYFVNAGKIIDTYLKPEIKVIESVQTSLIPFTERFVNVTHDRWDSTIGSSIDFNSRTIKNSKNAYFDLWLSKVDLARANDIRIIPNITPNKKDTKEATFIYNWLRDNHFTHWSIDRYSNVGGELVDYPSNKEHAGFLTDLYLLCYDDYIKNNKTTYISTITSALRGLLFGQPGDRWGGTCQSSFIVINPDGSLNSCPDRDSFEKPMSNIKDGVDRFIGSDSRKKWIRIQSIGHNNKHCLSCEHFSWCKSGCPINNNSLTHKGEPDDCSGFSSFLNHVQSLIERDTSHLEFAKKYIKEEISTYE